MRRRPARASRLMGERTARRAAVATSVALVLGPLLVPPASAQFATGPSILSLLPVNATIEIGGEFQGEFSASDYLSEGRRVKAFAFEGAQGAPVTIDLISDDFDSYLYLLGPDGVELETDDDSGGACHARIATFLPSGGRFTVIAASLSGAVGAFTLRTDDQQHPVIDGDCGGDEFVNDDLLTLLTGLEPMGTLGVGDEVSGSLEAGATQMFDGSYLNAYRLSGTAGETVVVDLMSRAFDTLLFVLNPAGDNYTSDDDSGGACNSRMEITLEAEPHLLIVNSLGAGATGAYTLKVSAEAGPEATGECPVPPAIDIR